MNDEGALIAFTLLSQAVIGSTLVYVLIYFINMEGISQVSAGFNLKTPEFLLLIGLLVAIILSFLHLGRPSNATNALNNLKSSWISREIFTVALLSAGLLVLFMARWLGAGKPFLTAAFVTAAVAGLLLLVTMTRLYMIPAVHTWNNWLTPLTFTLTALVAGLSLLLVFVLATNIEFPWVKSVIVAIMVLLLFEIVHSGILHGQVNSMDHNFINPFISGGTFKLFTIIRISLIGLTIVFLLFVSLREQVMNRHTLLLLSLSLIFIEMIIGRYLFFASYVRTGI